jgi:hypothetical protein
VSKLLGIDKVQLFVPIPEVTIQPYFPATIQNPVNAATGEPRNHQQLYFNGEQWLTGQRAHYNTKDFQLSILPGQGDQAPNCIVQFSANAFAESNEVPLNRDRLTECARDVRKELLGVGLDFPMEKARLVRLDIAKNVELAHPIASYSPVFQALSTRKSVNKVDFGGTGFLAGNTQRQIAFYDKGAEMHAKGHELDECPINTLRPELRFMKGRAIRAALGFETLEGLKSAWETLHGVYSEALQKDVFRPKMEQKTEVSLNFYDEARFVMDGASKRKWTAFKGDIGLLLLVEKMGLDGAKHFATTYLIEEPSSEAGKRQAIRLARELEQADYAIRMRDSAPDGTPLKELYRELRKAILS